MRQILIHNQTHPGNQPIRAQYCSSFSSRFRGLMFRETLGLDEGIVLVQPRADRMDSSIHMMFMRFDIAAIWLDSDLKVVDAKLARRWRLAYFPAQAAQYVLETHPNRLNEFHRGDQLVFQSC